MKKLLIKSGVFLVLFVLIISVFFDPFFYNKKDTVFRETINQFKSSNKDSVDIIFFGSSHSFSTFNPEIIDKSLGTYTFNLGSAGQRFVVTNFLQKEVLRDCKPKLVVLDLFTQVMNLPNRNKPKGLQLNVFDNMGFSLSKTSLLLKIYKPYELPSVLSETIRNHSSWHEMLLKPKANKHSIRGFVGSNKLINESEKEKYFNFKEKEFILKKVNKSTFGMNPKEKDLIVEFITYANQKNIEVLVVSAPYINALFSDKYLNFDSSVKHITDSLGVKYLNFNTKFNKLNLQFSDFRDRSHVNLSGSNKVTSELTKFISHNYGFDIKNNKYLERVNQISEPKRINENKFDIDEVIKSTIVKGSRYEKEFEFTKGLEISKTYLSSNHIERYIIFELKESFDEDVFNDKEFGVHFLFYKEDYDKRPEWIKKKNKNRQTASISPKIITFDKKKYVVLSQKTEELRSYLQIRVFLKNKGPYKRVIGKGLDINNVNFERFK